MCLIGSVENLCAQTVINPGDDFNSIINKASGGDVIEFNPGIYQGSISLIGKNFSESNPLIIKSAKGPNTVSIVKGDYKGSALSIKNSSYIMVNGIRFNGGLRGTYPSASNHLVFVNCEFANTGQEGIHVVNSTKHVDILNCKIYNTGVVNPSYGEGIYLGSGGYSTINFPDNVEHVWIEGNEIHDCGNGEGINIKAESFHITVRGNTIYNIAPGTDSQYNQAAVTIEGASFSIANNYRLTENRDYWIENNEIYNVTGGNSPAVYNDNGIMAGGMGAYLINNYVHHCGHNGIYENSFADLGLPLWVHGNILENNNEDYFPSDKVNTITSNPGVNPNKPQSWYDYEKMILGNAAEALKENTDSLKGAPPFQLKINKWKNGKKSAIALTFDDGNRSHYEYAAPILNAYGFLGTFYLFTEKASLNWKKFASLSEKGHEIGAHSVSHSNLTQLPIGSQTEPFSKDFELYQSKKTIEEKMPNRNCVTFAYPYCQEDQDLIDLASQYYIAARDCGGVSNASSFSNKNEYALKSYTFNWDDNRKKPTEDHSLLEQFKENIQDSVIDKGRWTSVLFHDVVPFDSIPKLSSYKPTSTEVFIEICKWLKHKSVNNDIWVATFSEVTKYIKQRDAAKCSIVAENPNEIQFKLDDGLEDELFDVSLSLEIPIKWNTECVVISKKGKEAKLPTYPKNGKTYVSANLYPDGSVITLKPLKKYK